MSSPPEVIAFPDPEALSIRFLRSEFSARGQAAGVGVKIPTSIPNGFVRVSLTGGGQRDMVTDSPRMLYECYASSTVAASALATFTRALMLASGRLSNEVTRAVDGSGVAFLPDPSTNNPRYQFVVQLDLRGSAI